MKVLGLAAVAFLSSNLAFAGAITTGDLVYDEANELISGGGNYYLDWGVAAGWTYQRTLEQTSAGGMYEDFHIANQTEAFTFFNLATTEPDAIDYRGVQNNIRGSYLPAEQEQNGKFGLDNLDKNNQAWFLSDEDGYEIGTLMDCEVGANFCATGLRLGDSWRSSVSDVDIYTSPNYAGNYSTWLLVANEGFSAPRATVPEPSSLALLGISIIGLGCLRRRTRLSLSSE